MSLVCATDFSVAAQRAADIAHGIARRLRTPLTLLHVLEMPTLGGIAGETVVLPPPGARGRTHADAMLAEEAARIATEGVEVTPRLVIGEIAEEIVSTSEGASLVVCGSHGRGAAGRLFFGSVADRLVRRAHTPLLVVRGDSVPLAAWAAGEEALPVLVGIDGDETLPGIATLARLLESAGDCRFQYAHVVAVPSIGLEPAAQAGGELVIPMDATAHASETLRGRIRDAGLPAAAAPPHVSVGRPGMELIELAWSLSPGLVLTGTRGRTGPLLGSTAEAVLHRSPCPVAIAPLPSRESS